MSVTGPGCAACSFTGTVPWASEPGMEGAFDVKPCDACGGFSWFRHRDEAVALAPAVSIPAAFTANKHFPHTANREFIAHARTDVPALVAEVRRLRAQRIADLAEHVGASARWGDRKVELLARVVELEAAEKALRAEVDEADARAGRFAELLRATADALKGPPQPLALHSWHDLPEVAAALRAEVERLRAEVDALKAPIARRVAPSVAVDVGDDGDLVVVTRSEAEAFAAAHPYAAGAILGGVAHRSEGGDHGA